MPRGEKITVHTGEALVLRTWPFGEADLLVSLFTREHGRLKAVARHAMRSRRRFGGALEPMTHVLATWGEKPRHELARLDQLEILRSPMTDPIDFHRLAALELLAEVLDEFPEGAVEDPVFRLALSVLPELQVGNSALPAAYFLLWMNRLMGWMPELGRCVFCGRSPRQVADGALWWSATADGVTCTDDQRPGSLRMSAHAAGEIGRAFRTSLTDLLSAPVPAMRLAEIWPFAVATLERHLEHRLRSAAAFSRS